LRNPEVSKEDPGASGGEPSSGLTLKGLVRL
jgi:hypothetical protein